MKRPYNAPRILTQDVHLGVYGDYGSASGDETFRGGPAAPPRFFGGGQDAGS